MVIAPVLCESPYVPVTLCLEQYPLSYRSSSCAHSNALLDLGAIALWLFPRASQSPIT